MVFSTASSRSWSSGGYRETPPGHTHRLDRMAHFWSPTPSVSSTPVMWLSTACFPWACSPAHHSCGFQGWEQAWWSSWPSTAHTSPHHHHHISQGRNHGNCWNMASGDSPISGRTVWFGMHMFPVRLLCALLAYSLFQKQRRCISNKRNSGIHDLTQLFINLLISSLLASMLS